MALCVTGCREDESTDARTSAEHQVDPQILQDAIEAAYMVPGSGIGRAMRVMNFLRGVGLGECGGGPVPLDNTYDRYSQDLYPDLELIRERGLTEHEQGYSLDVAEDCPDLAPDSISSWPRWFRLIGEWTDLAYSIRDQDPGVAAERPGMATCLKERTGLEFEQHNPTSYLSATMVATVKASPADTVASRRKWSTAYADCSGSYFGAMADALLAQRDAYVERNRETLTAFAEDLAAAGYVP